MFDEERYCVQNVYVCVSRFPFIDEARNKYSCDSGIQRMSTDYYTSPSVGYHVLSTGNSNQA